MMAYLLFFSHLKCIISFFSGFSIFPYTLNFALFMLSSYPIYRISTLMSPIAINFFDQL